MNRIRFEIKLEDLISFSRGQPQISMAIKIDRPRTFKRCVLNGRTIGSGSRFTGSRKGRDRLCFHIDTADDMIADIANVQIAVWPELNAVGFVELCFGCGASIPAITWLARSSQRRNRSGLEVDFANRMVVHVDNEKVAGSIESNLMG